MPDDVIDPGNPPPDIGEPEPNPGGPDEPVTPIVPDPDPKQDPSAERGTSPAGSREGAGGR